MKRLILASVDTDELIEYVNNHSFEEWLSYGTQKQLVWHISNNDDNIRDKLHNSTQYFNLILDLVLVPYFVDSGIFNNTRDAQRELKKLRNNVGVMKVILSKWFTALDNVKTTDGNIEGLKDIKKVSQDLQSDINHAVEFFWQSDNGMSQKTIEQYYRNNGKKSPLDINDRESVKKVFLNKFWDWIKKDEAQQVIPEEDREQFDKQIFKTDVKNAIRNAIVQKYDIIVQNMVAMKIKQQGSQYVTQLTQTKLGNIILANPDITDAETLCQYCIGTLPNLTQEEKNDSLRGKLGISDVHDLNREALKQLNTIEKKINMKCQKYYMAKK